MAREQRVAEAGRIKKTRVRGKNVAGSTLLLALQKMVEAGCDRKKVPQVYAAVIQETEVDQKATVKAKNLIDFFTELRKHARTKPNVFTPPRISAMSTQEEKCKLTALYHEFKRALNRVREDEEEEQEGVEGEEDGEGEGDGEEEGEDEEEEEQEEEE